MQVIISDTDVNPICLKHEVHRWHLRATVTAGLLQQQQFLQPEQHDYPGHLTSTAFWTAVPAIEWRMHEAFRIQILVISNRLCERRLRAKKESVLVQTHFEMHTVKIFLVASRFNTLVEIPVRSRCLLSSCLSR